MDDRPAKLLALEDALQELDQHILKAQSGADALRILLQTDVAVILLDVSMPLLDGFETAALIRQRPRSEHTPIIFVTSINTNETHVTRGYSLGAVDYIFSPIDPEILRAKVNVFIDLFRKNKQIQEQSEWLRSEAERRAAILESRLHGLLNTLNVGVFRADLAGKCIEANPAFLRLLRLRAADEFRLSDLLPTLNVQNDEFGVLLNGDVRFSFDHDTFVWLSLHLTRTESEDGPIIEGLAEDITSRKLSEQALRSLTESLERRVAERTEQLRVSQENLRHTEHLASLGTLAAGIAHEINNPLNSILMASQVASRMIDKPEQVSRSLAIISEQTRRCGRIIKSVLQLARNEQKPKSEHDLNALVAKAVDLLRSYVRSSLTVDFALHGSEVSVYVNPTEIEQVIINILQNSVYAARGEACVEVSPSVAGDNVVLSIRDHGPGIPQDVLGRIFDPFFSTRLHSGGTGLGLSVAHGIIREHNGSIRAENHPSSSALFVIELPLRLSANFDGVNPALDQSPAAFAALEEGA